MKELLPTIIQTLPLLILAAGLIVGLLIDCVLPRHSTRLVQGLSFVTLLCSSWVIILQFQGLTKPETLGFFSIDFLGTFLTLCALGCAIVSLLNAEFLLQKKPNDFVQKIFLVLFATIGVGLVVMTHHLFVCFMGLELFGLSTRTLMATHQNTSKSCEATLKSFVLGWISSGIFLLGVAFLFAAFGTFDLNQINNLVISPTLSFFPRLGVAFILVGLFSKLSIVPFQAWLTDVCEGTPAPWAGFILAAAPLAFIGFLLRLLSNTNIVQIPHLSPCLVVLGGFTLLWGSFVALKQEDLKRLTSCWATAQTGIMLLILALGITPKGFTPNAIQTVLFLLTTNTILILGVFSIFSTLMSDQDEGTQLVSVQGLIKSHPILGLTLTLFLLGWAGGPATIGFIAKYRALWAVIQTGHLALILGLTLVCVVLSFSCLRPVFVLFSQERTSQTVDPSPTIPATIALTACVFLTVFLGISPQTLTKIVELLGISLQ